MRTSSEISASVLALQVTQVVMTSATKIALPARIPDRRENRQHLRRGHSAPNLRIRDATVRPRRCLAMRRSVSSILARVRRVLRPLEPNVSASAQKAWKTQAGTGAKSKAMSDLRT